MTSNGSNESKKYELKRWNTSSSHDYLYNFYKYWKNDGVTKYLTSFYQNAKPVHRLPDNCKIEKYSENYRKKKDYL